MDQETSTSLALVVLCDQLQASNRDLRLVTEDLGSVDSEEVADLLQDLVGQLAQLNGMLRQLAA